MSLHKILLADGDTEVYFAEMSYMDARAYADALDDGPDADQQAFTEAESHIVIVQSVSRREATRNTDVDWVTPEEAERWAERDMITTYW